MSNLFSLDRKTRRQVDTSQEYGADAFTLRTQDRGRWTEDGGRRTWTLNGGRRNKDKRRWNENGGRKMMTLVSYNCQWAGTVIWYIISASIQ